MLVNFQSFLSRERAFQRFWKIGGKNESAAVGVYTRVYLGLRGKVWRGLRLRRRGSASIDARTDANLAAQHLHSEKNLAKRDRLISKKVFEIDNCVFNVKIHYSLHRLYIFLIGMSFPRKRIFSHVNRQNTLFKFHR